MASKKIKQWVTKQDGLDNLQFESADMPEPREGEVLVKINTVSLNYRDTEGIPAVSVLLIDRFAKRSPQ